MAVLGAVALLGAPASAPAHGPCGCTSPTTIHDLSQRIRTGTAFRVVWNPSPDDFAGQTTPREMASGHRPDAPTETVLDLPRDRTPRRAEFRAPADTPPGLYFVLIYDGSEGGTHTSWDYVQVAGAVPTPAPAVTPAAAAPGGGDGRLGPAALGALAGALVTLAAVALASRLRRRRDP